MRHILILMVLLDGCGGVGDEGAVRCADRHGLYRAVFVAESGTCPARLDDVVDYDAPKDDTCRASWSISGDNCSVETKVECPTGAGVSTVIGKLTWNQAGTQGTGTASITFDDGRGNWCHSVYRTTYTKL